MAVLGALSSQIIIKLPPFVTSHRAPLLGGRVVLPSFKRRGGNVRTSGAHLFQIVPMQSNYEVRASDCVRPPKAPPGGVVDVRVRPHKCSANICIPH